MTSGLPVIVLGAGHGRRMGGPKVLTVHGGRTFLERVLARCHETASPVTLVLDPGHRSRVEAVLETLPSPLPLLVEADGTQPMLTSLRAALRLGDYAPGSWVWPVDAPFISAAGWRRAVAAVGAEPRAIWKLKERGRTGHPIWFPARTLPVILEGDWKEGLRTFLAHVPPEEIRLLHLEGEVISDFDTPEALAEMDVP